MASSQESIKTDAGIGRRPKKSRLNKAMTQIPVSFRKNYGLVRNPDFWALLPFLLRCRRRETPFADNPTKIFVATHHKSMTTYFKAVLQLLAFGLGARFEVVSLERPRDSTNIFLSLHSKTDLAQLDAYRGVHIMRDPRDMIVSSYHYHLWTNELWVHVPDEHGQTYQEKLRAADKTEGLFMTIRHFIFFSRETLENWDMEDPDMLEIAYDELMGADRDAVYHKIFGHLGLTGDALELSLRLMRLFEAGKRSRITAGKPNERAHIRSGKSNQWKAELEPAHLDFIERELGQILDKFGYERTGRA